MRACRSKSGLLAVVAERAFECASVFFIALNHPKWAGDNAIRATVTDVGLHIDAAELGTHD